MKKLLVFLAILFVSVMSSACINNFAIQELNEKAELYLEAGNFDEAAKRLESSVDLDGSVFETRYNLAVAYIGLDKFDKAIEQLKEAVKINPQNADAYHTLGVAYEGKAYQLTETKEEESEEADDKKVSGEETIDPKVAAEAAQRFQDAINSYKKYLEISKKAPDKETVEEHIKELQETVADYVTKYIAPKAASNGANG